MATITLRYDSRDKHVKKLLDSIVDLGLATVENNKTKTKTLVVKENKLMTEIRDSLREAKKMESGILPRRNLNQLLNGK